MDQKVFAPSKKRKASFLGKQGTVAVMVAVCAPLLLMTIGLGIEANGWIANRQGWMQRTADMAAIAGGLAYSASSSPNNQTIATEAAYIAEANIPNPKAMPNGTRTWTNATSTSPPTLRDTMVANNVITTEIVSGIKNPLDVAISATVQYTLPLLFSALAMNRPNSTITLSATAIAELIPGQIGKYCVLALDPGSATGASTAGIQFSNGSSVDLSQCGIEVNATGTDALYLTGGASLLATSVSVGGGYVVTQGASMTVSGTTTTNATTPGANPYATVVPPTPDTSNCVSGSPFITGQHIPAGTYCGDLTISYGTVTMGPGTIIINNGNFNPGGGSTINATAAGGTTIVMTSSGGGTVGSMNIGNGITLNITAPTTGPLAGIALFDPAGTATSNIAGGASMNVNGAMVFPTSIVDYSNGSNNSGAACTQLIAYQVVFTGGATFANNCAGTGTQGIGANTTTTLVQ